MGTCTSSSVSEEQIQLQSVKEFKDIDKDNSKTACKAEIKHFVCTHGDLWKLLETNIELPEWKCKSIATNLVIELATGVPLDPSAVGDCSCPEVTMEQFHEFRKKYMLDRRGTRDFFYRAVFAAFDYDGDRKFDDNELDDFLDVLFQSDSLSTGEKQLILPQKESMKEALKRNHDFDRGDKLSYDEIKRVMQRANWAETQSYRL